MRSGTYHPRQIKNLAPKKIRQRRRERAALAGGAVGAAAGEADRHDRYREGDRDDDNDEDEGYDNDEVEEIPRESGWDRGSAREGIDRDRSARRQVIEEVEVRRGDEGAYMTGAREKDCSRSGGSMRGGTVRGGSVRGRDDAFPEKTTRRDFVDENQSYTYRPRNHTSRYDDIKSQSTETVYEFEREKVVENDAREADARTNCTREWVEDLPIERGSVKGGLDERFYTPAVQETSTSLVRREREDKPLLPYPPGVTPQTKSTLIVRGRGKPEETLIRYAGEEEYHSDDAARARRARPGLVSRRSNSVGVNDYTRRFDEKFGHLPYEKGAQVYSRRVTRRRVVDDEELSRERDVGVARRGSRRGEGEGRRREGRDIERLEKKGDKVFSDSPVGLSAGALGAVVGGWAARQATAKGGDKNGRRGSEGGGRGNTLGTVFGAAVGGLVANAVAEKWEESRKRGERGEERKGRREKSRTSYDDYDDYDRYDRYD